MARGRGHQAGMAMVTVLFVTVAVMLMAVTFSIIATSERRSTSATVQTEEALQLADAGTERARRIIIDEFNNTFLSIGNFLQQVGAGAIANLAGVNAVNVGGQEILWEVLEVSDPSAAYGWIDVAATADLGSGAVQTVIRRVGFGASSTFNLAMLSETTDCMFCHLRVNGDVGNLVFMRPGWGDEGVDGHGSGGSGSGLGVSRVNGNVYAAMDVTNDVTSGNRLNGAEVTGVIERNSRNASLPTDLNDDGIPDFPPINREIAMENALGTVSGGVSNCIIPIGGTYGGSCTTGPNRTGTIDGNLILVGTAANPIDLDGDIWVEGDIIIKGYVTGQGGIYAGRNVYLAGDVQTVNPPYRVSGNNCVNEAGTTIMTRSQMEATGFGLADACARRSIADDTDALRIAARGSIIVGDYTEYDADGDLKAPVGLQSSEFYRQQFGFNWNQNRRYDPSNGDELRCATVCLNADNQTISNTVSVDGYDGSFRPGNVTSSGFDSWITDAQYSTILGTEDFDYNSWRWEYRNDYNNGTYVAEILAGLIESGFPYAQALQIVDRRVNFRHSNWDGQFDNFESSMAALGHPLPPGTTRNSLGNEGFEDGRGTIVDDSGQEARYFWSGNSLRVVHTGTRTYETQVNRIDAFLYANQRIAGKTSMQAMSITGGLVARDLGILAPGRALEEWTFGANFANRINNNKATACSNPSSDYYVYGSEDCALTVNYDHRLRNGGYGYNIISGSIGITLDWRVADSRAERVTQP